MSRVDAEASKDEGLDWVGKAAAKASATAEAADLAERAALAVDSVALEV